FTATATRRTSTPRMVTPGPDQLNVGGFICSAWSAVWKSTKPKPSPSTGSSQYPPTNPAAALTRGRMSFENAAAAAGARAGSIVSFTTAAYMLASLMLRVLDSGCLTQRVLRTDSWAGYHAQALAKSNSPTCESRNHSAPQTRTPRATGNRNHGSST